MTTEREKLKIASIEAHHQGPEVVSQLVEKYGTDVLVCLSEHRDEEDAVDLDNRKVRRHTLSFIGWIALPLFVGAAATLIAANWS